MAQNVGLNATQLHDELLGQLVEGARHDADLCPFCQASDAAATSLASGPSGDSPSGASPNKTDPTTEGGTHTMSDTAQTVSKETHEALLAKAVADATSTTENALERKTIEASELSIKHDELASKVSSLTQDNARLNKELDEAQVKLRAATDEVATLKADITAKDEAARLSEVASKRADQVKNLQLFPEDYIGEKASAWARLSDEDWAERVDEWAKARPTGAAGDGKEKTETASAMTGTSGDLTKDTDTASDDKPPARRTVLGLS